MQEWGIEGGEFFFVKADIPYVCFFCCTNIVLYRA